MNKEYCKFMRNVLTGDLKELPSINEDIIKIFNENGVNTTYQLVSKYLSFKDININSQEHISLFRSWLISLNVDNSILEQAIGEKCNQMFPGIYELED